MYVLKLIIGSWDAEDIDFLNIAISKDPSKFNAIQREWEIVKNCIATDIDNGIKIGNKFFEKYKVTTGFGSVDDIETNRFVKIEDEWYTVADAIKNSEFVISMIKEV